MIIAIGTVWAVVTILILGIIFSGFFSSRRFLAAKAHGFRDYQSLHYERSRLIENLHDLETDFEFKKIKVEDYEDLKADLLLQLEETYKKIDAWEAQDPQYQMIVKKMDERRREA